METKILLVACFVFAVCLHESYATKCYICDSCPDPFDKSKATTQDCPNGCIKTKGKILGMETASRGCAPGKMDNKCTKKSEAGISGTVCGCNSDLCNAATTSSISITAVLSLVAGIFVYKNLI